MERPNLTPNLSYADFQQYYYLKKELVDFCRQNGLSTQGAKTELTQRIEQFLLTGRRQTPTQKNTNKPVSKITALTLTTLIEANFRCSQHHRAFFSQHLGPGFKFNVRFQKWLKANSGKTYQDAIEAYQRIQQDQTKTTIDPQFEYNTYIRDFFQANQDRSLQAAIRCWKKKKSLPGHNRYEAADLLFLREPDSEVN